LGQKGGTKGFGRVRLLFWGEKKYLMKKIAWQNEKYSKAKHRSKRGKHKENEGERKQN
jgi:hypothetical protein